MRYNIEKITYWFIIAILLFMIAIPIWYLYSLYRQDYIVTWLGVFNFSKMKGQFPFISEYLTPLISLASCCLLFINLKLLRDQNLNNEINLKINTDSYNELALYNKNVLNNEKRKNTLDFCTNMYLNEIQAYYRDNIAGKGFITNKIGIIFYQIDLTDIRSSEINENDKKNIRSILTQNHKIIADYLNKLEAFSTIVIKADLDIDLTYQIIGRLYLAQNEKLLPFIIFYRNQYDASHTDYGNNTIDLIQKFHFITNYQII